jgi:hypothetical protein
MDVQNLFYSSGAAARELHVSQARIRGLCESGAIEATSTPGGQWRISQEQVQKLKRDGLPAVPRPMPEPDHPFAGAPGRVRPSSATLLAEPSDAVIQSSEQVVRLQNEVASLGLLQQKEEALDFFREREAREAEREEAERERQDEAEAERERQAWEARWIEYALDSVPSDAPQSVRLDVNEEVEQALERLDPTRPDSIIRQLVDAAVDRALAPWRKSNQVAESIKRACEAYSLPWDMKHDSTWKARMYEAAAAGIARVRDGASEAEMDAAARQAIAPIVREFEHQRSCEQIVDGVWRQLSGANTEEREQGKETVQTALAELSVGVSQRQMEQGRDTALEPIRAIIAARQDREMRAGILQWIEFRLIGFSEVLKQKAVAAVQEALNQFPAGTPRGELEKAKDGVIERYRHIHERHEQKGRLIDGGLRQIRPYLDKLTEDWEFEKSTFEISRELKEPIQMFLERELDGSETEDRVSALVRRGVREELDIP